MARLAQVRIEVAQARAVSVAEAGQLLSVSEHQVRRMIELGEIPVLWIGKRVVVPLAQLDEWIAKRHIPAATA